MKDLQYYMDLQYPFILEQDDDGSYFIEFPDLPGCMSCGANINQVIEMAKDAKKCWIESALKDGDFIPEPAVQVKILNKEVAVSKLLL